MEVAVRRVDIAQEPDLDIALEVSVGGDVDIQALDGDVPAVQVRPVRRVRQVDEHEAGCGDEVLRIQVDGVATVSAGDDIERDPIVIVLGIVFDPILVDEN